MPETTSAYITAHERAKEELAHLQGVWNSIAGQRQAELLVAGKMFTIRFFDGALYMGSFDLSLDENPRAMDMRVDEGPVKHKGLIARCIYELSGDMLRWCPGAPGSEDRPAGFPADEDGQSLCLVFRREYPRWPTH